MAGIVVVFDFDKTIIDCDSDNWVVDELGPTDLFNQLLPTLPLNSVMTRMIEEIHSKGKTIDDVAECLKRVPLHPRIIAAIKSAHSLGCELRIVSDANVFFIETVLKHHGLLGCFTKIHTNPSFIDEEGHLRILPYHDFISSAGHGCNLPCPPNMCKGLVMESIRDSAFEEGKKRFIYLGDGEGDFCPSFKLREGDFVMPRKNYPVWELISTNILLMKAEVHGWSTGDELEQTLLCLINRIINEDQNKSTTTTSKSCSFSTVEDCGFQSEAVFITTTTTTIHDHTGLFNQVLPVITH